MQRRKLLTWAAASATIAMSTTGCLSAAAPSSSTSGGAATAKTKISVMYAFGSDQSVAFQKDMTTWGDKNGVTFDFIQSDSFEKLIQTKVASGDLPDIAIYPQPGILKSIATKGLIAPLKDYVDVAAVEKDILPGFLKSATVNDVVYGAPMAMNIKSLYWYDKANFTAKGYTVPKTQAELETLLAKIKADGTPPMCLGLGSGSATGWPGTDWIEDYVLQTSGADVYDKWVAGTIKFDSPEIRKAFDVYSKILMTDGYVYGGTKTAASAGFGTALNPMFDSPAKCYLGKQGNFITGKGYFPDAIFQNLDAKVGVFATPSVSGEQPILGGGDLAAAFTKNDSNVKKVMNLLTNDPTFGAASSKTGQFLSPHKSFDGAQYPNQTMRDVVKIASGATVFRFDGSDQMPGAVGSGSFWTGMVDYTSGNKTLDQVLPAIDKSWPTS